jgi:DNA-binding MarR family transcriptional regulator
MIGGLLLLSGMSASTSRLTASAFMFVLGLGLGSVMQVLVLAVQNAVDYSELGVATSGATLFRSIGGTVGTAILGSIFTSRLSSELATGLRSIPGGSAVATHAGGLAHANPAALSKLPAPVHTAYIDAFTNALGTVFTVAAGVAAIAFLLSWILPERPLRESVAASSGIGESFAVPKHTDSLAEISRGLSAVLGREERRRMVEQLAERAGVDLSPAACWLDVRLHQDPRADIPKLASMFDIPDDVARSALSELEQKGMVRSEAGAHPTTPAGDAAADRLIAERRAGLCRLLDGWAPDQYPELAALVTRLAHELSREPSAELTAAAGSAA